MSFVVKMDDKKIKVDIESTQLKDILIYCKPKERLVLMRKFWLNGEKEIPLQKIWKEYSLTRERVRQIETQALMRFRRLIVGNEVYMNVLSESKKILEVHGGILSEDSLISKIINKNLFKFSKQELKLILVSDFDITYLKRNKYLSKAFYIEPLYEDLLTKMVIFSQDHFNKRKESQDLYEFISVLKAATGRSGYSSIIAWIPPSWLTKIPTTSLVIPFLTAVRFPSGSLNPSP